MARKGEPGKRKKTADLNILDKKLEAVHKEEIEEPEKKVKEKTKKKKPPKKKKKKLKLNVFSGELEIFKIKLPYWKWLLFLAVLSLLFLGFYFLGWYFAKGKVVLAYESPSDFGLEPVENESENDFGRSPVAPEELDLYAESALVIDRSTGVVLAEQDKDKVLPIASLTKLVTAQVALEQWSLDEALEITREFDPEVVSSAELMKGKKYLVHDLLRALLISSAAESAYAFADAYPGGEEAFILEMNRWTESWGFGGTRFVDPVGLKMGNASTAYDIGGLARLLSNNEVLAGIVGSKNAVICSLDQDCVEVENTNELLFESNGFIGMKTGYTVAAGPCLVAWYNSDNEDLLVVLLNANDRFETARYLVRD